VLWRLLLCASLLAPQACGYRFTSGPASLPEGIRAVRAPVFQNHTPEPALQITFSQALREQLTRRGIEARADADAELAGEVIAVWVAAPVLAQQPPVLASYRVGARARLTLTAQGRGLASTEVTGTEEYLPGADILQTEANRQAALRRLAERLMRDGFERMTTRG
jgi:hypothetical protein